MEKRIIHVDMDAFYAQVEQNDNPKYRGKPVIVGGRSFSRGVVTTASYEARKFGVHSAMSMKVAYKKCPDGIFVKARFDRYKEISAKIKDVFLLYTDIIEPLSLDEAYLDITHLVNKERSARMIALEIQSKIFETTGLTSSAGISYNKYLAKIASGMNKPKGTTVIDYDNVQEILWDLKIGKFPGVGKVTEQVMLDKGIYTGKDLYEWSKDDLILAFGKRGENFYNKARGIGTNTLEHNRVRQSIGKETTFSYDRNEDEELLRVLLELTEQVSFKLVERQMVGRVVTVKLRNNDFSTHTKQMMSTNPIFETDEIYEIVSKLYLDLKNPNIPIRLIGVSVSALETREYRNMTIYDFI